MLRTALAALVVALPLAAQAPAPAAAPRAAADLIVTTARIYPVGDTRFPTNEALSRATPDNPVALRRVDGHAILANAAAMRAAGVTADTKDPSGGRLERDAQGAPTGVFVDNAMSLISRAVPNASR